MLNKKLIPFLSAVILCFFVTTILAQESTAAKPRKHKFTLYAGAGPNVYFNNLALAKDYVKEINYSFAGRFMWEPEHNLSLGIESGYYCLYTVDFKEQSDVNIKNAAIPIQLVVCMKFLKHFYFSFASGQSILMNDITQTLNGDISASTISLGDFAGSLGYKWDLKERFSLGAETKFFYASKLNDKNLALLFMVGYHL